MWRFTNGRNNSWLVCACTRKFIHCDKAYGTDTPLIIICFSHKNTHTKQEVVYPRFLWNSRYPIPLRKIMVIPNFKIISDGKCFKYYFPRGILQIIDILIHKWQLKILIVNRVESVFICILKGARRWPFVPLKLWSTDKLSWPVYNYPILIILFFLVGKAHKTRIFNYDSKNYKEKHCCELKTFKRQLTE